MTATADEGGREKTDHDGQMCERGLNVSVQTPWRISLASLASLLLQHVLHREC